MANVDIKCPSSTNVSLTSVVLATALIAVTYTNSLHVEGREPMVRRSIYSQHLMPGILGIRCGMVGIYAPRLRNSEGFLDGERVWLPVVRQVFTYIVPLTELRSWVKQKPMGELLESEKFSNPRRSHMCTIGKRLI